MKIVLPKTLAEPLTIPWFLSNKVMGNRDIVKLIHEYVTWINRLGLAPGLFDSNRYGRISCQHVLTDMIAIVERHGGNVYSTKANKGFTGIEHTGYFFIIEFWTPINRGKLAHASFYTSFRK